MRNVEAKFPCDAATLAAVRERAQRLGARHAGTLHQVDTYFRAPLGRLKLREVRVEGHPPDAVLIGYTRPDAAGARESTYEMVPVADPAALTAALLATLGVCARVVKVRELWLVRHTRIHLDTVERLGTFVELETLVGDADPRRGGEAGTRDRAAAERELAEIVEGLGLRLDDGLPGSYADLVQAREEGTGA
jgi:adenylate cyclase, class 2